MLPKTEATEILRSRFGGRQWDALLEQWVNYAVGMDNRDQILGREALERAIDKMDVHIKPDPDLLFDGELRLVDGRKVIFLREGIEQSRRNFTIAHELGHATLFQLDPSLPQDSHQVERLCNLFAAELLLPVSSVRRETVEGSYVRALVTLAARSGASLSTTCIRITECFGGAAGIASVNGEILREYGHAPSNLALAKHLSMIAKAKSGVYGFQRLSHRWILETGFVRSKCIYVLRRSDLMTHAVSRFQ